MIPGVTVTLTTGGNDVATAVSDANGAYLFDHLVHSTYQVRSDESTLPASEGTWSNTYSPAGGANSVSGDIVLDIGEVWSEGDFGYFEATSAITLDKTAKLSADGSTVNYTFVGTTPAPTPCTTW